MSDTTNPTNCCSKIDALIQELKNRDKPKELAYLDFLKTHMCICLEIKKLDNPSLDNVNEFVIQRLAEVHKAVFGSSMELNLLSQDWYNAFYVMSAGQASRTIQFMMFGYAHLQSDLKEGLLRIPGVDERIFFRHHDQIVDCSRQHGPKVFDGPKERLLVWCCSISVSALRTHYYYSTSNTKVPHGRRFHYWIGRLEPSLVEWAITRIRNPKSWVMLFARWVSLGPPSARKQPSPAAKRVRK